MTWSSLRATPRIFNAAVHVVSTPGSELVGFPQELGCPHELEFRTEARALLARDEEACILAREIGAGAIERLRIGFVGSLLYCGLPRWVRTFRARHSCIDVVLIEQNSGEQSD